MKSTHSHGKSCFFFLNFRNKSIFYRKICLIFKISIFFNSKMKRFQSFLLEIFIQIIWDLSRIVWNEKNNAFLHHQIPKNSRFKWVLWEVWLIFMWQRKSLSVGSKSASLDFRLKAPSLFFKIWRDDTRH